MVWIREADVRCVWKDVCCAAVRGGGVVVRRVRATRAREEVQRLGGALELGVGVHHFVIEGSTLLIICYLEIIKKGENDDLFRRDKQYYCLLNTKMSNIFLL